MNKFVRAAISDLIAALLHDQGRIMILWIIGVHFILIGFYTARFIDEARDPVLVFIVGQLFCFSIRHLDFGQVMNFVISVGIGIFPGVGDLSEILALHVVRR